MKYPCKSIGYPVEISIKFKWKSIGNPVENNKIQMEVHWKSSWNLIATSMEYQWGQF